MGNVAKQDGVPLQETRIIQASVMDDKTVLLSFSNGTSALVDSEDLKELVVQSKAKLITADSDVDPSSEA